MITTSQMYELSLSIGESVELRANCDGFLSGLLSAAELTAAGLWLKHHHLTGEGSTYGEEAEDVAVLLHGTPADRFETYRVPLDHPIFEALDREARISIDQDDERFLELRIEPRIHRGVIAAFSFGDLGFLHLYSNYRHRPFTSTELRELGRVVSKFTTSLEASLAYHRLTREMGLRRRVESRLQHKEEHFRALIESSFDIILVLDYDATVTFASPSVKQGLGYEPEAVVGRNFFELLHPEEVSEHFQRFLKQVQAPGIAPTEEMRVRHHNGTWRSLTVSSNNLLSVPSVAGIIMNCHDVTERNAAREALRKSEERFSLAVRGANDGLWDWDLETDDIYFSPRWAEMAGCETAPSDVSEWFDLVHVDDLPALRGQLDAHLEGDSENFEHEYRLRHSDGDYRWMLSRAVAVHDESGKAYRVVGSQTDITDRKRWTQELEEARRRAIEASRAKSDFVANMSHEIRNPLNGVIGMASLLLETDLGAEQRDFAKTIRVSADTLATTIEDILDFSRIESGKLEITREAFDLGECVEGCLDMVAAMAGEKGLDLGYVMDVDMPRQVVGDVVRFRQVLLNLLSNAVKFTTAGEVVVSLAASPAEDGDHEVRVSVRDTGIGIPRDEVDRLFQPFIQADASTTRKHGGTGLGLAISRRLCELMSGGIRVEPTEGGGATFVFTIRAEAVPAEPAPPPALEAESVLVVDDNESIGEILSGYIEALGVAAHVVCSGPEARDWLSDNPSVDAVVVDLTLPGMDGIDLGLALCSEYPRLPLILARPLGFPPPPPERTQPLFEGHLTKPVKPHQLRRVLEAACGVPEDEVEAPPGPEPAEPEAAINPDLSILLAEDDEISRKVALLILRRFGCRAETVADGHAALEALEEAKYDLVLMDVQMPGIDGLEATRRIRERFRSEGPRIIATTARATREDRERCLEAGMDGYISKPIQIDAVRDALIAASSRVRAPGDGRESPKLDLSRLESLRESGGQEFLGELIEIFLDDVNIQMGLIRGALDSGDAACLEQAAHKVRSASSNLGVVAVSDMAGRLEDVAHHEDLDEAQPIADDLEVLLGRVKPILEREGHLAAAGEDDREDPED